MPNQNIKPKINSRYASHIIVDIKRMNRPKDRINEEADPNVGYHAWLA
jgi:hypothetical protein